MNTSIRLSLAALVMLMAGTIHTAKAAGTDRARNAIESQQRALLEATQRGDAAAAASLFTVDAKLSVGGPGGIVTGRAAIQQFWHAAVNSGMKGMSLADDELAGEGELRFATGRYSARAAGGTEVGTGDYLIVWKKEAGAWKIHRDYAHAGAAPVAPAATIVTRPPAAALPANYRAEFVALGTAFNENNSEITATYANATAASVASAGQLPYAEGAVFLMEFASGQRDGEGQLVRDAAGQVLKGEILHIDVMQKGYGRISAGGSDQAGQWEFASYRADGTVAVAPADATRCAVCHRNAGVEKDFVFRQRAPLPR